MEPQQQQQNQAATAAAAAAEDGGSGKSSYLCRQSSTRWAPTTDQIRILKDLYYNNGVRSPNAEQIQRISARLRQYGKIEGKNVFYWFQNHKARERQKKRFTSSSPAAASAAVADVPIHRAAVGNSVWKTEDSVQAKYPSYSHGLSCPSSSSSSSPSMVSVGHMVGGYGYGAVTMENNFRECSISAGTGSNNIGHNFQWAGVTPQSQSYYFFDKSKSSFTDEKTDIEEESQEEAPEIETLPLFPMHGEDSHGSCGTTSGIKSGYDGYNGGCHWSTAGDGGPRTSLEISLNSFAGNSPNY
ncbi:hypothetical protein Nepgr_008378 [Nepenthes gracilis]|uniref:Homeobox domain-containing protein n=1 Tax=Nepenthes gracilis TaxID=150966 RepID=A0AAD3XJ76_NEPGR|nr:hypothetical protein Nepgr_008378 [Nepenthes gracilis]